jgi:hypothetical protein
MVSILAALGFPGVFCMGSQVILFETEKAKGESQKSGNVFTFLLLVLKSGYGGRRQGGGRGVGCDSDSLRLRVTAPFHRNQKIPERRTQKSEKGGPETKSVGAQEGIPVPHAKLRY